MPWFGDYGILYYRHRPAEEVRLQGPADDLGRPLQDGEEDPGRRAEDEPETSPGFVFQGNSYEGLTCKRARVDRVGGRAGPHDRQRQGVDQQHEGPPRSWTRIRAQVGKTHATRRDPPYQEDQTEHAFDAGDAAFARNWPYQYGIGANGRLEGEGPSSASPTLPHGAAGKAPSATVGGWQLAVSKYSKHQGTPRSSSSAT